MDDVAAISVVLCTHDPREDLLGETLARLREQSLATEQWELIVVDNASPQPVEERIDITWHPAAWVVREDHLGLTAARVRGFEETRARLIVMVDDDNLLATDYLERALEVGERHPNLGVYGGHIEPRFETPPPEWSRPFWFMLALREIERDVWGNIYDSPAILPCGAGMCVRRAVAENYAKRVNASHVRREMDRRGSALSSAGDTDLAFTALDEGYGMGQFRRLRLEHVIPPHRLEREYLVRLWESMNYSGTILKRFRDPSGNVGERVAWSRLAREFIRKRGMDRRMWKAERRGKRRAEEELGANDSEAR